MSGHAIKIARIAGIEISIHWSWLIIFVLLTWSLATAFFPAYFPFWSAGTDWVVSAISTVLLFVSVLLHELGHSLVAEAEGIQVKSITLFVFGGVSNIQSEPHTAGGEFLMAVAGPLVSIVLGVISYVVLRLVGAALSSPVQGVLLALAYYNITLAVFNLIPGFPLDGGRIFRSIVWAITHNFREATSIATAVGHFFGYLFIVGGIILAFFAGDFLSGIWLVFIGWWLNSAAEVSQKQTQLEAELRGVPVARVMRARPIEVPADTTISDFVEHYVLGQNARAVPVVGADRQLVGLATLAEARAVPRDRWATTTIAQVMLPVGQLTVAHPDEPLVQALRDLGKDDINQLPVVDHGALIGLLTRSDVIRYLQIRQDLGKNAA